MDNPGTQYYESIVQCADGVKRHFIFNKATFCDAEGKVAGIVGVMLDITERKRVEESLRDSARRLRFLSSKLLSVQESESRRISMEIHDALGQNLAVLKLQLDAISKRLRKDQRPLKDECRKALGLINQVIESARNLSRDLSPSIIEDLKLGGTLKWMLQDFKTQTGIQTVLEMDDINGLFSNDDEVIIYRIFQEALRNVIKHAEAHRVKVGIERRDREVTFQIADDGKGFDLEKVWNRHVAERSLGLAALYERSRMLGGSLEITSRKGQGTRITLKIAPAENKGEQ
jgi:signal transduction histidine kinase